MLTILTNASNLCLLNIHPSETCLTASVMSPGCYMMSARIELPLGCSTSFVYWPSYVPLGDYIPSLLYGSPWSELRLPSNHAVYQLYKLSSIGPALPFLACHSIGLLSTRLQRRSIAPATVTNGGLCHYDISGHMSFTAYLSFLPRMSRWCLALGEYWLSLPDIKPGRRPWQRDRWWIPGIISCPACNRNRTAMMTIAAWEFLFNLWVWLKFDKTKT